MNRFDCIDLKVQLSAYMDGELSAVERAEADRHLLACQDCRQLLERAESTDQAIRTLCARDPVFVERAGAALPLPAGFEEAVLGRPRLHRGMHRGRLYSSLGLLAAAASLALVAAILFIANARLSALKDGGDDGRPVHSPTAESLDDGICGPPNPYGLRDGQRISASLAVDELQAIQNAAQILHSVIDTPFEDIAARDRLRQMAIYDELSERLAALQPKLDPSSRRIVGAARASLLEIQLEHGDVTGWSSLQDDLRLLDLAGALDSIALAAGANDAA